MTKSNAIYVLSRPLAFSEIEHKQLNDILRLPPLLIALAATTLVWYFEVNILVIGEGSLSRQMSSILSTLPGFFIAVVVVIATFQKNELDRIMPKPTPQLRMKIGGEDKYIDLTFRMFLSFLFSYLTIFSLIGVFLYLIVDLAGSAIKNRITKELIAISYENAIYILYFFFIFLTVWFLTKTFLTTLLGLYFFTERIHHPDA